jgi:hypothetical protein
MTKQEQLVADITASVMKAMDQKLGAIACPLEPKERKSVRHLYGLIKDIGNGDTDQGIRKVRAMFTFIDGVQTKKTVVTGAIFTVVLFGVAGTMLSFLWCSIKEGLKAAFK